MQGLVEEEHFLVLVQIVTTTLSVVVVSQFLFTFLVGPLDY